MKNPFEDILTVADIYDGYPCDSAVKATYAADAINGREALESEREALRERNAKLVEMLKKHQYRGEVGGRLRCCMECLSKIGLPCRNDCELAALLAEEKE